MPIPLGTPLTVSLISVNDVKLIHKKKTLNDDLLLALPCVAINDSFRVSLIRHH